MKKKFEQVPLYEIVFDEDSFEGISLISIVQDPAIMQKGMYFSEVKEYEFKLMPDQQMIAGPAMIPDIKIPRIRENGEKYNAFFSKETIRKMVNKFKSMGTNRKINFNHTNTMVDGYILGDWIVQDPVYDKSKFYGYELPVGSYFTEVKIEDKNFWEVKVKEEGFHSFSIQGMMGEKLVQMCEELHLDDIIDSLTFEEVEEMFGVSNMEFKVTHDIVHPNCRCTLNGNEFILGSKDVGADGKPIPCQLCLDAQESWKAGGQFVDVFGNITKSRYRPGTKNSPRGSQK